MPPVPVPAVSALVAALSAALGPGMRHTLTATSKSTDAYEAYLMAHVLGAAVDLGLTSAWRTHPVRPPPL
jgi:hypothetical protein